MPAELPPPDELVEQHPGAVFVVAYSRISDDWRKNNKKRAATSAWAAGRGVANQHRRNDATARRHNLIIVRRYTDNDLSASELDVARPGFESMLADLRRGYTIEGHRVDGALAIDQDRVQRTMTDWERFVEVLTGEPDRFFWTPSGPVDFAKEDELIRSRTMALVNQGETIKKKQRTRDWHQDRILDGLPHSGPRPFGWDEDRLTLRPAEADFLRWAIAERIKGNVLSMLCAEAGARRLRGTKGGEIIPQTLTQMMTAPRVCGYRANRGDLVLDEYGEPIIGIWQTIVSPAEWRAVCATFSDGSTYLARGSGTPRVTGVPKTIKYLASSLLRCAREFEGEDGRPYTCGYPMNGRRTDRSRTSPYNYTCGKCRRNAIAGPMVDETVTHLTMARLQQAQTTYKPPETNWPLEATLTSKADRLAGLEARWEEAAISDLMFYRLAPKLEQEIRKLRWQRAQWEQEVLADHESPADIIQKWESGEYSLTRQRKILFDIFTTIHVSPGKKSSRKPSTDRLTPVWNEGFRGSAPGGV